MSTFLKTFFICLVLTISFLAYTNLSQDSYSDLQVSKRNPVFGTHHHILDVNDNNTSRVKATQGKSQTKNIHKCYFFGSNGKLVLSTRKLTITPSLENSLKILFKGPTIQESRQGIYSEIPPEVELLSVNRTDNKVIVDVSSNFGLGGGTKSVEDRIKQITRTIKLHEKEKDIYLYINGDEVEYLGGEGVFVKQPLN